MKHNLAIIITEGHPFIDTGFIYPELKVLCTKFNKIEVYPLKWSGNESDFIFPDNVFVKSELSDYMQRFTANKFKIWGFISPLFYKFLFKVPFREIIHLSTRCGYVSLFARWILLMKFKNSDTLYYTYWLTLPSVSLSFLKSQKKIRYFISRAHGYDLYNERGDILLNILKPYIFKNIDGVFCISQHGKDYLEIHYPSFKGKYFISRLGIENEREMARESSNFFELLSCSYLVPVKRVDLLVESLSEFQVTYPDIKIRWTHIGGGPGYEKIKTLCQQKLKPETYILKGNLENKQILDLYAIQFFSCFINVSSSEGISVSIMEAQSAGIPVIATAVGGTPEIVNDQNGLLLSQNPTPQEISAAIYQSVTRSIEWGEKRLISRKSWVSNYNSKLNYAKFSMIIDTLLQENK